MGDGAMCHDCRTYPCLCAERQRLPAPRIPDQIQLSAEIPVPLREPSTHPEAVPLIRLVQDILGEPQRQYAAGALHCVWVHDPTGIYAAGVQVFWYGRPVLVNTRDGDVWLYRPGPWEDVLRQRAAEASSSPPVSHTPPEATPEPSPISGASTDPPAGIQGAVRTGGGRPGEFSTIQDVVDASTATFKAALFPWHFPGREEGEHL